MLNNPNPANEYIYKEAHRELVERFQGLVSKDTSYAYRICCDEITDLALHWTEQEWWRFSPQPASDTPRLKRAVWSQLKIALHEDLLDLYNGIEG